MPTRPNVHPSAAAKVESFFPELVAEVAAAVANEPVVVVGVAWNAPAKKARRLLDAAGIRYRYLEYGNYVTGWRKRVALKIWAGWPTFPQVYVKGALIGGASELGPLIKNGELQKLLDAKA